MAECWEKLLAKLEDELYSCEYDCLKDCLETAAQAMNEDDCEEYLRNEEKRIELKEDCVDTAEFGCLASCYW